LVLQIFNGFQCNRVAEILVSCFVYKLANKSQQCRSTPFISARIKSSQLWLGHVLKTDNTHIPKQV